MSGRWRRVGRKWEIESPLDEQAVTFSLDDYLPRGSKVSGLKLTYATNSEYVSGDAILELIVHDSMGDQTTTVHSSVALEPSSSSLVARKIALPVNTRLLMSDGKETMIRVRYTTPRVGAVLQVLGVNSTYTYTNRPAPYPLTRLVAFAGALALTTPANAIYLPYITYSGAAYGVLSPSLLVSGQPKPCTWGALVSLEDATYNGFTTVFGQQGENFISFAVHLNAGQAYVQYVGNGGGSQTAAGMANLESNPKKAFLVCGTLDATMTTLKTYVNGALVDTTPYTWGVAAGNDKLYWGSSARPDQGAASSKVRIHGSFVSIEEFSASDMAAWAASIKSANRFVMPDAGSATTTDRGWIFGAGQVTAMARNNAGGSYTVGIPTNSTGNYGNDPDTRLAW